MWWIQQILETFKSWLRQSEWLHIVKIRHLNDLEVFEFCILHTYCAYRKYSSFLQCYLLKIKDLTNT